MDEDPPSTLEALRGLILRGVYKPGEKLGEVELAERLDVSRTPVREALRRLAADGLVEIVPHKGARVVEFTDDELEHIFDLRAQVEGTAARRAAATITDEELDRLEQLAEEIALYALPGPAQDLDRVYGLNAAFHAAVAVATRSSTLTATIDSLFNTVAALRTLNGFDADSVRRSVAHHLEIVAALRARDGRWAESVMRAHLFNARASMLGPLRPTTSDPAVPRSRSDR
ncbi:GntR family transcriptional regulator [Euzebya sp.]|uniref:GntR family transcriptional regulator n=1 Tax=Euzebya sp. TaxID=1971409 RepID=UPI003517F64C